LATRLIFEWATRLIIIYVFWERVARDERIYDQFRWSTWESHYSDKRGDQLNFELVAVA